MKRPLLVLVLFSLTSLSVHAQGRGGRGGPPPTAKAAAPFEMTGNWISIVGEDWRWRMFPNKGDYGSAPLNPEGRRVADAWDPVKDATSGEQCKGYAAPVIMRIPGRFRIAWQDDQTLKIETDAGTQTRVFHFANAPQGQGEDWQGLSKAEWDLGNTGRGGGAQAGGSLKVVTTKMKPGYVTRNGAPYSANATLTEYYDLVKEPNGDQYLVLTSTIDDPMYLNQPMMTAVHFKKQAAATGWNPTRCASK